MAATKPERQVSTQNGHSDTLAAVLTTGELRKATEAPVASDELVQLVDAWFLLALPLDAVGPISHSGLRQTIPSLASRAAW